MSEALLKDFQAVVLAALLHDTGKFMQRANKYACNESNHDPKRRCGLADCDGKKTGADYRHSCHSYWFLEKMKEIFPGDLGSYIIRLAFRHHEKTADPLEAIVRMSDHFSAGCDRTVKQIEQSHYFKRQPLRSIFDKVAFPKIDTGTPGQETFYKIAQLGPEHVRPFRSPHAKKDHDLYLSEWRKQWNHLAEAFEGDLTALKGFDFDRCILALNTILERYTWCIPSSTWRDEPDISLYDHLATSAAFAAAMFRYYEDKYGNDLGEWDVKAIDNWNEKDFYFVAGDLSGIQEYLFDLRRGKFAAKLLRARSFELQMLSEASIRHILRQCSLPPICRVMNAAGRFILVLPNTQTVKDVLDRSRKEIETFCRDRYVGQLTVNISRGFEVSGDFLRQKQALEIFFPRMAEDVDDGKQHKFQTILRDTDCFFIKNGYEEFKSNQDLCPSCGKRPVSTKAKGDSEDEPICEMCHELIELGKALTQAEYMKWVEDKDNATLTLFGDNHLRILRKTDDIDSDVIALKKYEPGLPLIYATFHVPTVGETAETGDKRIQTRVRTFEELANQAEGDDNIAMFKADVDNLGSIFSIGMGDNVSISRFATLSRTVNYFFSSYVNHLIESNSVYRQSIYAVFSGGDDLCVVGPWDKTIDFARKLAAEFVRFVGENHNVTISAGIAVSSPKQPAKTIFLFADESLSRSKTAAAEKDRITLFDTTIIWRQFEELMGTAHKLEKYIDKGSENGTGKGIFYRLLGYGEKARALDCRDGLIVPRDALWISHFYYDVARNIKEDKREEFKILCMESMKNIRLPVSYVLYKTRNRGGRDGTEAA
jgi:CRISPR-associated protein Csm1